MRLFAGLSLIGPSNLQRTFSHVLYAEDKMLEITCQPRTFLCHLLVKPRVIRSPNRPRRGLSPRPSGLGPGDGISVEPCIAGSST